MRNFYTFLDTVGDGTGSDNANVNGSISPVIFKKSLPPNAYRMDISRMIIGITDVGSIDSASYGNGIVLTNGITLGIYQQGTDALVRNLTPENSVIKTNHDWAFKCHDLNVFSFGTGSESLTARWSFTAAGAPEVVGTDEYFGVVIADDLTGLIEHKFQIQGRLLTLP